MKHVQICTGVIGLLASFCGSASAISPYFVEDFPAANGTADWGGGVTGVSYSNPGTGGVGGDGDGYLRMSRSTAGAFGVRSFDGVYVDNYITAGITGISLWLNDIESDQDFQIFVSIGNTFDIWQYDVAFQPPENGWGEFFVDLTDESMWSSFGFNEEGTLADALTNADRILIRHSTVPPPGTGNQPPPIAGELGIDRITFIPSPGAATLLLTACGMATARRRRSA